jgi:hypothetical protein
MWPTKPTMELYVIKEEYNIHPKYIIVDRLSYATIFR